MKRMAGLSLVALLITLLPPLSGSASAALHKEAVARCRDSRRVCWPTGFAFTPDGATLFYIERFSGHIRMVDLATGADSLWKRVQVGGRQGEQGLLGIAVDPDWPVQQRLYIYVTKGSPLRNRIVRITKNLDGSFTNERLLGIRASEFHNGGVIHFGPDGMLWAVTGDAQKPGRAQRRRSRAGKVLRLTEDGEPAPGNPFGGRFAWSRGHRNSFGFAFDPVSGMPWQTENGPECNDEINIIKRGRNYGWGPASSCPRTNVSGSNRVRPRERLNPVRAPTGAAFCSGCGLGSAFENALLVGSWNDRRIRRFTLNAGRDQISGRHRVFRNNRGVLAVEAAPGGKVYFSDRRGIYVLEPA